MHAIYHFDLVGKSGGTMGGSIFGDYTVAQALAWALDDLATGRAVPIEICAAGVVVYDAAQIWELAKECEGATG